MGLVELGRIRSGAGQLFGAAGAVFDDGTNTTTATVAAGAVLVFFVVSGFLTGYLMTRTVLTRMFATSDAAQARSLIRDQVARQMPDAVAEQVTPERLEPVIKPMIDDAVATSKESV